MDIDIQNPLRFERPPIIEMALGVQFAPIANFTGAHYGWFWKHYLDAAWTKAQDALRLPPQFEKFGEQGGLQFPGSFFIQSQGPLQPQRILLINEGDDRIIQLQNDRFHYNWRKREGSYPSFPRLDPEFRQSLQTFEDFVRDSGLDAPLYNQWELTYFNSIPKGELWDSPSDWVEIFPGLFGRTDPREIDLVCESSSGMLKFEIPPKRGRLYVVGQHAKIDSGQEVLQVDLTARGPVIDGDEAWNLANGMTAGHAALVRTFRRIASPRARSYWGER
jgi:uncharacterized protein (TIGR04255 family)